MGYHEAMEDMDYFDGWNDHDVISENLGAPPCTCSACEADRAPKHPEGEQR